MRRRQSDMAGDDQALDLSEPYLLKTIGDCAYMPAHLKNGAGGQYMKDLASKTHKVLPAGGIYMRHCRRQPRFR